MYKFFICYHVSTHGFNSFTNDTLLIYLFNSFMFHYDSLIHVLYSSIDDSSVASRQNWDASSKNCIQPWEENIRSLQPLPKHLPICLEQQKHPKTIILGKWEKNPKPELYCWWLKSCTTWDVWNPINNGIYYLSTGAGFQPSTVWPFWGWNSLKKKRGHQFSGWFFLWQFVSTGTAPSCQVIRPPYKDSTAGKVAAVPVTK